MRLFSRFSVVVLIGLLSTHMASTQPRLLVQDTINWGKVVPEAPPGETAKLTKEITLKNVGNKMLRISEVRPSCGCTSAPLDKDSLKPGESTTMRITLNLPLSNGSISKYITIRSNDQADPVKTLTLMANVQRPLQMSSAFIPFNQAKIGKPAVGAVTLSSFTKKKVDVKVTTKDSGLKILTPKLTIPAGGSADIKVEYMGKKEGPFTVEIDVTTTLAGYEKFTVKGYGAIDP